MTDALDRLTSTYLEPPDEEEARAAFTITDDRMAVWALDKLRAFGREKERLTAARDDRRRTLEGDERYQEICAELDQNDEWYFDSVSGPNRQAEYFADLLRQYVEGRAEQDPTIPKTYKLPNGSIPRRKLPDTIDVTDEDAFVAWARDERPDLLKTAPAVAEIKRQISLRVGDDGHPLVAMVSTDGKGKPTVLGERGVILAEGGEEIPGVEYVVGIERVGDPEVTP